MLRRTQWQTEQNGLQKWHRVSTPYPFQHVALLFRGQLVVCQDFSAGKIMPSFRDLSWLTKTPLGQICLKIITKKKKKIAVTSTIKVKSWINIPYIFQNYCMFQTSTKKKKKRERTILRTSIIWISFCQFQWFIAHKKKRKKNLQNKLSTFTKFKP